MTDFESPADRRIYVGLPGFVVFPGELRQICKTVSQNQS